MNGERDTGHRLAARTLLDAISLTLNGRRISVMEVCGGHTMAIWRHGLPGLLGDSVALLSGPGCPVCVTPNAFLDRAMALSRLPNMIIVTFGDLMRVPGSRSHLARERAGAGGGDIRPVYSSRDALEIARQNPQRMVVFLGIGFETTAPTIAATVLEAHRLGISNFRLLSALKTMPQALRAIAAGGEVRLNGMILPGHVTAITGTGIYAFLAKEFGIPGVVAGFEALDILQSLHMLARQHVEGNAQIEIQYRRVAKVEANARAIAVMDRVFMRADAEWRGLGVIAGSGLALRPEFERYDAAALPVQVEPPEEHPACRCGDVIRAAASPEDCPLFGGACTPERPVGACMVSEEGTCAAHYRYRS